MSESRMWLVCLCDGDHKRELEIGISVPLFFLFSSLTMLVEHTILACSDGHWKSYWFL